MQRLGAQCNATNWRDVIAWAAAAWKGKRPKQIISRMGLQTLVYTIWSERNARTFRATTKPREMLNKEINSLMYAQILTKFKFDVNKTVYASSWE